jgi:hypothetical protein
VMASLRNAAICLIAVIAAVALTMAALGNSYGDRQIAAADSSTSTTGIAGPSSVIWG